MMLFVLVLLRARCVASLQHQRHLGLMLVVVQVQMEKCELPGFWLVQRVSLGVSAQQRA